MQGMNAMRVALGRVEKQPPNTTPIGTLQTQDPTNGLEDCTGSTAWANWQDSTPTWANSQVSSSGLEA